MKKLIVVIDKLRYKVSYDTVDGSPPTYELNVSIFRISSLNAQFEDNDSDDSTLNQDELMVADEVALASIIKSKKRPRTKTPRILIDHGAILVSILQ